MTHTRCPKRDSEYRQNLKVTQKANQERDNPSRPSIQRSNCIEGVNRMGVRGRMIQKAKAQT